MKKVLKHDAGLTPMVRKADWLLAKENPDKHGDKDKPKSQKQYDLHRSADGGRKQRIPEELRLEVAKERAGGASVDYLAKKYCVSNKYIDDALQKVFISSKVGREILKNVILENGIAAGMHARRGIEQLSPMQAVMATGIMSSKFVELDKHTASQPAEVDFQELQSIGENLKLIKESLGDMPEDLTDEDVIDV